MAAITRWCWLDVRRRWRSLLVLALLIAFAAATVMTAVAGARRGATAVDRLVEQTLPATVLVLPNTGGFDWSAIRDLPEVAALSVWPLTQIAIDGLPPDEFAEVYDEEAMRTLERPVVLEGRLPDPQRPDEAVATPGWVDEFGLDVGDTVGVRMLTPDAIDGYNLRGVEPEGLDGPAFDVTIVGVVRSPWFSDAVETEGKFILSPAVFDRYPESVLGAANTSRTNALVRLHGGQGDIEPFRAGLARVTGTSTIDVWDIEAQFGEQVRSVTRFEANGLLVFASAAALAAVFLVGQSVARHTASTAIDLHVLAAVGLRPGQARWGAAAGPGLAAIAGSVIAVGAVVIASRWFPIGTAALNEPAPGIDVDGPVLAAGVVGVPLLVVVAALAAAALTLHRPAGGSAEAPRQSRVVAAAAGAGLPVSAVVGARFAFEPGRGPQSLPVRPALLGSIVGVAGALAALTFSAGVDDATRNLERFGVVHDLELFIGIDGTDYFPADDILTAVASVEGVAGVNDTRSEVADTGNGQLAVLSVDPVGDPLEFVVSEGRLPYADGELTIGPASARSLGVGVGDTIELTGTTGTATVTVVGIGLMPQLAHNFYTDGGLVTAGTYDGLFDGFRFRAGFIGLAPGADPISVVPAVQQAAADVPGGEIASVSPAQEPSQVIELQQVRVLPVFLAGFLALLALGAVGHALATAVRRRRHDLAVLRALGMTRAQSRWVVVTQASMLAVVGALVGLPLGVALGRTIWRYVAETTPLLYVPPVALIALLVVVPVALVAANALAAWPGHRAASLRVAQVLRTE
jgi:hypothetical protein